MFVAAVTALFLAIAPATAGSCDSQLRVASASKGTKLAGSFAKLAQCDKTLAEEQYLRLLENAQFAEAIVGLSFAAIDHDIWNPVYRQLGKISSYDDRDLIAQTIGESCKERERVVTFLQGAYFGLRDLDFQQWDDAFIACDHKDLTSWIIQTSETPPEKLFDEKYNALMTILIEKLGAEALNHLATAAIRAAAAGPFDTILTQMDASVAPGLGQVADSASLEQLEAQLLRVARAVGPEKARVVADRLATSGADAAAARLLPEVYPDLMKGGGAFLYGAAAIETGDCKGVKTAVLHYAEVEDPGTRWVILADVTEQLQGVKPKLSKCEVDEGPWAVATTPEPVKSGKDVDSWVEELAAQWKNQGYSVKTQSEKAVKLP